MEFEIIETEEKVVSCKGPSGSDGHPLVYLNRGNNSEVVCPYCSRKFVLKVSKKHAKKSH